MGQDQTNNALIQDLVDTLPDTISQLETSRENIDEQIGFLTDDWYGVSAVMSVMATAGFEWITGIADELTSETGSAHSPSAGRSYGITNITDWIVYNMEWVGPQNPDNRFYVPYSDADVTSGAPSAAETMQYNRQTIDFPNAYDNIYHSNGLDGTYGILNQISNLNRSKDLQTINQVAYEGFFKAYERNNPDPPA